MATLKNLASNNREKHNTQSLTLVVEIQKLHLFQLFLQNSSLYFITKNHKMFQIGLHLG